MMQSTKNEQVENVNITRKQNVDCKYNVLLYCKCAACGLLCIYLVWSTKEILALKEEVRKRSFSQTEPNYARELSETSFKSQQQFDETNDILSYHEDLQLRRAARSVTAPPTGKRRRRKHGKKKCKCKEICKRKKNKCRGPRGAKGNTGPRGPPGPPGLPGPPRPTLDPFQHQGFGTGHKIVASHFTVEQTSKAMRPLKHSTDCTERWGGLYCFNNNTFYSKENNQKIEFLEKQRFTDTNLSPLNDRGDGTFEVKVQGLYLLYINIQTFVNDIDHTVALYVGEEVGLECISPTENITEYDDGFKYYSASVKMCSTVGVFQLKKGQKLSIKIEKKRRVVRVSPGTNFGAILLSPG